MRIVVLAAFELEIDPLVRAFKLTSEGDFGFTKRWKGKYFDLVRTNIGKVHAAAVTQYVIDTLKPDWIVNVGISGGFAKKVSVGELVLPSEVIQHDMDQRKYGFPLGRIHAIEKVSLPLRTITLTTVKYKTGLCISGDKLLSDKKEGSQLYMLFHPTVVDMELGSIAQVCYLNKIKLLALKSPVDIVEKEEVKTFESRVDNSMKILIRGIDEVVHNIKNSEQH